MYRFKFGIFVVFALLCLSIPNLVRADGWVRTEDSWSLVNRVLLPQNDPDARNLSAGFAHVEATTTGSGAQATGIVVSTWKYTWTTQGMPAPALNVTFSGQYNVSVTGNNIPYPTALSSFNPYPKNVFLEKFFGAPPNASGTYSFAPYQASGGFMSTVYVSMDVKANAYSSTASAFSTGSVSN